MRGVGKGVETFSMMNCIGGSIRKSSHSSSFESAGADIGLENLFQRTFFPDSLQPSGRYKVCMLPADRSFVPSEQYKWQAVDVTVDASQCGGTDNQCCPFGLEDPSKFPFTPVDPEKEGQ